MRCVYLFLFWFVQTIVCEDYYDLLGIQKDAENREIRKAFKKLALKYHPDKNQGKDAHEKFIAINKAYEVLKDEEMRKKYDLHGEEGLKEDFGKSWKGSYHSWNYYYESFGIYDDDPEIITLSRSDFDRSVLDSPDLWFVNFYSPQCSHCHQLAPAWRKLARELQGVIQIGAVNCEEDWMLCRMQSVFSYPSLVFYPQKRKYQGSREAEDMIEHVLQILPYNVIRLTAFNYVEEISNQDTLPQPWLIFSCKKLSDCFPKEDLKKLGVILDHLVHVAELDIELDKVTRMHNDDSPNKELGDGICEIISCDSPIMYYANLNGGVSKKNLKGVPIDELDTHEIVKKVLHLLPEPQEISSEDLKEIRNNLQNVTSIPWLIKFVKDEGSSEKDMDLKRLKSYVPEVLLGQFNCYNQESTCKSLHIVKFPTFLLFRPGDTYEFHYGSTNAFNVKRFVREALSSLVHTLSPEHFPEVTQSEEIWFIDFFAPWCPPCMQFLPKWRKASVASSHLAKFGTVDCSVHHHLCRRYNINSYPSAVLYKQSVGHKFHGSHSEKDLDEFIQDILSPVVISLSPSSFEKEVKSKKIDDVWVIDFFAPWCGPCQQLAPHWRKVAKMLKSFRTIHVGEVDCEAHQHFCSSLGVNTYPTIRLFPSGSTSSNRFYTYNGWSRDASSLQAWVFNFISSKVLSLSDIDFQNVLADDNPWIIYFFAPWCSHCQTFAPEFEKIAKRIEGKVKAGKVNCDQLPRICRLASVRAYPTVLFYKGQTGSKPQKPAAEEIETVTFNGILSFLDRQLNLNFQKAVVRDEL